MSAQNNIEEETNECTICYGHVREKADFFTIMDCCDHIHCYRCFSQWEIQQSSHNRLASCTYCRRTPNRFAASLTSMKSCTPKQRAGFLELSFDRKEESNEWLRRMRRNGMQPELCTFNCGFVKTMEDGTLMCPHGLYDKGRYEEEEQRRNVDKAEQLIAEFAISDESEQQRLAQVKKHLLTNILLLTGYGLLAYYRWIR